MVTVILSHPRPEIFLIKKKKKKKKKKIKTSFFIIITPQSQFIYYKKLNNRFLFNNNRLHLLFRKKTTGSVMLKLQIINNRSCLRGKKVYGKFLKGMWNFKFRHGSRNEVIKRGAQEGSEVI